MTKTKIPWCDYTINPVKGLCPMACPYCYARRMYKRFKWNPEIRFDEDTMRETLYKTKTGDKIFMGSTMELFGDWVKFDWCVRILDYVRMYPSRIFIFLTKQPQNMVYWSPFPDNCIVGVSIDGTPRTSFTDFDLVRARRKIISYEPLLAPVTDTLHLIHNLGIDGVILGSQTQPIKHPKPGWVKEIIDTADEIGITVFVKEPLASHLNIHRKELPLKE